MFQKEILEDVSDHVEGYYKVMGKPARFDTQFIEEVTCRSYQKFMAKVKEFQNWDAIGDEEVSDIRDSSRKERPMETKTFGNDTINLKSSVTNVEGINIDLNYKIKLGSQKVDQLQKLRVKTLKKPDGF